MKWVLFGVLLPLVAQAQARPDEAALFGGEAEAPASDASPSEDRPSEANLFNPSTEPSSTPAVAAPLSPDEAQLSGPASESKFDTGEVKSDPLKVGGSVLMTAQSFFREEQEWLDATLNAPFILDAYLDGRPNDRVRAFVLGRLQFDPTRPTGEGTGSVSQATSSIGLTPTTQSNPNVFLDQFWVRFDLAQAVYFTVGRQKVRWGTARIWYPTDFLNSIPRDALNPFDARLGVNMVKVHVPVESLGWNFYAYGLLGDLPAGASGSTLEQLGAATRAELVLGPAELGMGGVWMKGRRPRYALDLSTPLGPVDVYAEAAFRDGRDFLKFEVPSDLTAENVLVRQGEIADTAFRPEELVVQTSGGVSWQFNYTDNNFAVLSAEYFYNPMGYSSPTEYLVQQFFPAVVGQSPDPIQRVPLYGAKHSVAVSLVAPGLPGDLDWITVNMSNILNLGDPSGLVRLDAIFRVLTYLNVQVFAQAYYGQSGGELRFALPVEVINGLVSASPPDRQAETRAQLRPLKDPPLGSVGVLLRLSI